MIIYRFLITRYVLHIFVFWLDVRLTVMVLMRKRSALDIQRLRLDVVVVIAKVVNLALSVPLTNAAAALSFISRAPYPLA